MFVLIIGKDTKSLRAGYCMYCKSYSFCSNTYKRNKSFIDFECDYAIRNNIPIIVLYNSTVVDKSKCLDSVKDIAICHVPMRKSVGFYQTDWDYNAVKRAFDILG